VRDQVSHPHKIKGDGKIQDSELDGTKQNVQILNKFKIIPKLNDVQSQRLPFYVVLHLRKLCTIVSRVYEEVSVTSGVK
jgi:hypothetical protein